MQRNEKYAAFLKQRVYNPDHDKKTSITSSSAPTIAGTSSSVYRYRTQFYHQK